MTVARLGGAQQGPSRHRYRCATVGLDPAETHSHAAVRAVMSMSEPQRPSQLPCQTMDSRTSSDPFVRNRHRWAAALWLVTAAVKAPDLAHGWRGVLAFLLTAVLWGVIAYMLGSHKDRDRQDFWRPLIGVWVTFLIILIGWASTLSILDGRVDWRWVLPLSMYAGMLLLVVDAYRRTRAGLPWRRSSDDRGRRGGTRSAHAAERTD